MHWLAGFTSGEGCFLIYLGSSPTNRLGFKVELCFQVTQHIRNKDLIKSLIKWLDCGYIIIPRTIPNEINFKVTKFQDITNKIIPIFKKYNILGVKALDFADWCKVAELMKEKTFNKRRLRENKKNQSWDESWKKIINIKMILVKFVFLHLCKLSILPRFPHLYLPSHSAPLEGERSPKG